MSAARSSWLGPALAIAAGIAAMLFSIQTLRDTPDRIAQITRRHADWTRLHQASAQLAADRAALDALTKNGGATPLADWLRSQHPNWTAEVREKEGERVTENWSLQRMQVTIPDVNLSELGATLDALAGLRPPWRAVEISISAAESGAGRGRASLLLEGLVNTPAATP